MKLIAMLRIKDEILHIEKCLSRLEELVDEIVILDNGSTDGTLDKYPKFKKIVKLLQTEGFDEGRDKIMLHEAAKERNPDWIIWLDGDEVFEEALSRKALNQYMESKYNIVSFRMNHFWMSYDSFRIDGKFYEYSLHPMPRMWRNLDGSYFANKKIHNGGIRGITGPTKISPFRILHYGYVDNDKVNNKFRLYNEVDDSGKRDYQHIKSDAKVLLVPYVEFKSRTINYVFIVINKYLLTLLHIVLRIYRKLISIFK